MHAELTITHEDGDVVGSLQNGLPPDNRAVLANSLVFGQNAVWQQLVAFATETPQWRLIVYQSGANELQMTIEPVQGNLRRSCESVWRTVRTSAGAMRPSLDRLDLVDEATTQVVARASVGFIPQVRRREFWPPTAIAIVSAIVLALDGLNDDTLRGTLAAFIGGTVALVFLTVDALRKKLVWHE
jgi:hypothetical protein